MYPSTKADVDRHVEECLKKINNESERNLRCFSFAKQYFKIERYAEARRYVLSYLSVKPNSAEAHHLLGRILEKLGKKEAAYQAYSTSLKIDPKQNNLVLKVCELLASDDVELDHSGAKYFCEMAQALDPHSSAVFNLKQRIITEQNDDPRDITNLLLKELEHRPTDIKLRVRLLKHLLSNNLIREAYKHVVDIESKNLTIFFNSLSWYEVVAEVLVKYQRNTAVQSNLTWEYWFLLVSVFDRLSSLSLDEHLNVIKTNTDYVAAVFNFDQTLYSASQHLTDCTDKQLHQEFLNHYRGQLNLHIATLIFKQANKNLISFKEAFYMALPTLFIAYHCQPPDLQSLWVSHLQENKRHLVQKWCKEASFRCSQAGHILLDAAKERKAIVIEKASQYSVGMWKEQLFKKLFITRDYQMKMSSSSFLNDQNLLNVTIQLPEKQDLMKYDLEAQLLHPDSLHHHIWIVLNNKLSHYKCTAFDGLQFSIKNLKNCGAETLNLLDIQAFIYAATFCAKINLENSKNMVYYNSDKPNVLPASITHDLSTLEQNKFFKSAYKMYKNEYETGLDVLRSTIIEGIKIIRCVDHVLDVKLLVTLATTFAKQAKKMNKQSEIDFIEARAALYWKAALPLLEKMKSNIRVIVPPNRMFNVKHSKEMLLSEICENIEKGKLFQATQFMKRKEYEKALHLLEMLRDPYASFHQAQIYKLMADEQIGQNKENVTSEMRSQNIILLSRARDCLYLTLDRLREPNVDQKHPLNMQLGTEIEKMENLLSRIDPDCTNRNECDGMSDGNVSSNDSNDDLYVSTYSVGHNLTARSLGLNQSTPYRLNTTLRTEAKPSPERLDAQLRQLTASKDVTMIHMLEQNKIMTESHRTLIEELRNLKEAVNHLTSSIDELKCVKESHQELKEIKSCMTELKTSISELDNFKTVTDMVYEMKKELSELKKDLYKTTQLSDEDIYGLTGDYGSDYNINTNLAAFNTNLYHNQPRVPSSTSLYPSPLYPLYPMAYAYGGLGLPPHVPGTLPINPEQQLTPDFRTVPPPSVTYGQTIIPTTPNLLPTQQQQPSVSTTTLFKETKTSPSSLSFGSTPSSASSTIISNKSAAPVNVVITTSDPLPPPQSKSSTAQILSVNIPVEHLKGNISKPQPTNYQIPLPSNATPTTQPSILSKPPPIVSTQNLLSNVAPPIYSAVKDVAARTSVGSIFSDQNNSLNKSNLSNSSFEEYDPCPDIKPIIPLPDEVPVTTGEENEIELFCEHAKLFRHINENGNKEWKERGIGKIKILKNPDTGKIRILMRRDQVHKICANHFLTKDMTLTPKTDKGYIWAANDFADQELVPETLCVRFKTPEDAKRFYDAFENAKKMLDTSDVNKPKTDVNKTTAPPSLGGFVFTSTPTFKPKTQDDPVTPIKPVETQPAAKPSPFSSFTFGSKSTPTLPLSDLTTSALNLSASSTTIKPATTTTTTDDDGHVDDFVPNVEFKPVIPLPDLVEVKTGEENSEVLFEHKAKLLRLDTSGETKEWKERGVGMMKILKDNIIRLVMRREQVHKVCCNHQLLKNIQFAKNNTSQQAVTWCAKDYSEGVIKNETFCVRFKTEEIANEFLNVIKKAQDMLDDNNNVIKENNKHQKTESPVKSTGFGDKFKPVKGSWECKNCYISNDSKSASCVACETPKTGTVKKDDSLSGATFSFGVSKSSTGFVSSSTPTTSTTSSWGNQFKPKEGSWECQSCYTRNDSQVTKCVSCTTPKDQTPTPKIPTSSTSSWGNQFKPKEGSWECKSCYTRNEGNVSTCVSCTAPKDPTTKETPKSSAAPQGISLDTGGMKFSFGIPSSAATAPSTTPSKTNWLETASIPKTDSSISKFTFGSPIVNTTGITSKTTFTFGQTTIIPVETKTTETPSTNLFNFKPATTTATLTPKDEKSDDKFVFGSPQKHNFEFTPRSPRRISSGQKDDESEGSVIEEENDNIYFKPVIPLPDKIEVKTGEEDEDVLYCHRAKLYRLVDGEWKERGLGDIKILKQKTTGKLRVLMRREQVFKICLNHVLTSDIKYVVKDEKTWLFCAPDFSEGVVSNDKFCIRFKTPEIAQDFKKAIDDALGGASLDTSGNTSSDKKSETDESDVVLVSETKVTSEEEQEAIKLGLPPKFMSYRQLDDCVCEQCKKDDEYLNETKSSQTTTKTTTSVQNTSQSTVSSPQGSETLRGLLNKPLLIPPKLVSSTTSSTTIASPTKTTVTTTTTPAANIFKPSIFQTPESKTQSTTSSLNTFSFSLPSNTTFGSATTTTGNLFSSPSTNIFSLNSSSSNVFGTGSTTSIFGSSPAIKPTTTTESFVFKPNTVFETKPATGGSIFGSTSTDFSKFGQSIFGGSATITTTTGATTTTSQSASTTKSIFTTSTNVPSPSLKFTENDPAVLNSDISFANLAAKVSADATPLFVEKKSDDGAIKPFAFLGAGAPVFGSLANKNKTDTNNKSTENADDSGAAGDDEYDPHYEPIVPLPDQIVVQTGEEDETPIFNERAKLYRYDSNAKEWKERGVGQMKILHHPVNDTYRFLLRREQVHKVVLNQLIVADLDLQPMFSSDKAWVWAGYNYYDDGSGLEKLAIRFKSCELAQQFHEVVKGVIEKLRNKRRDGVGASTAPPTTTATTVTKTEDSNIPTIIQNFEFRDPKNTSEVADDEYEESDGDEDDDDDDDDDQDESGHGVEDEDDVEDDR